MKKELAAKRGDDMRKEYDLSKLAGGVQGKYYRRATAGTNLVLIEPDLVNMFPDSEAVNGVTPPLVKNCTLRTWKGMRAKIASLSWSRSSRRSAMIRLETSLQ